MDRVKKNTKKGFTLVELMIVVVIMIILAAAATPIFKGYLDRAKEARYLAECRSVYVASQTVAQDWLVGDYELPSGDIILTSGITAKTAAPASKQGSATEFLENVQALAQLTMNTTEKYEIKLSSTTGDVTSVVYENDDFEVTFTPNVNVSSTEK